MVTLNSRKYRSFSSFFQKCFFFNKSVTLVSRNISGKFKKNLSTQISTFLTVSVDNFFLFFHHEILKYVSTHVQIFRVPYRTRFGNNHGFIPRGQSFSHSVNELTCAYMFSQAHLQKNTHKIVFRACSYGKKLSRLARKHFD